MVERVERDVAQQRTADRTLRGAVLGGPFFEPVENPLFEERLDQPQNATVRHLLPNQGEKTVFGNRVEIALQVGVDDVDVAGFEQSRDPPQRVLATPSGAKAVAVGGEVPFEDGSNTVRSAVWTTRSCTVGIPSGRFSWLPGLGM